MPSSCNLGRITLPAASQLQKNPYEIRAQFEEGQQSLHIKHTERQSFVPAKVSE